MVLSKPQLAGKLAKKTLSLDEKVRFLDFAKWNPTSEKSYQKYSRLEKLPQQILLKKRRTFAVSMDNFMKKLRNKIALASTEKLMKSYASGTWASNIHPNGPIMKEEAKAIKERLQDYSFDGFSASDDG